MVRNLCSLAHGRTSENSVTPTLRESLPRASPLGRLPLMTQEGRPTGIRYEDALDAARRGGNVDFEGRKVRVVSINTKSEIHAPHPTRLLLDLGDEYLEIDGYFSGDEFIEEGRQRRSKE